MSFHPHRVFYETADKKGAGPLTSSPPRRPSSDPTAHGVQSSLSATGGLDETVSFVPVRLSSARLDHSLG